MSQSILLHGAKQVLTLRGNAAVRRGAHSGNLEVIENGSVFIQDGRIASVGPTRRIENLKEVRGAIEISAHNCIVMPGFVDSSIQLSLAASCLGGMNTKRRKLGDFYNDSISLMRQCLQHGTLNAVVKASSGVHSLGADLSVLRQIARFHNTPVGLTTIWCPETDAEEPAAKMLLNSIDTVAKRKLADSIELHANPNSDNGPLLNFEPRGSLRFSIDWEGGSPGHLQECLDRCSPSSVFCHHPLSQNERHVLAHANVITVFSAGGALLDESPNGSVRDLLQDGGAVALGSGYNAQREPNFNMQLVLAMAVRRLNLTTEEAIVATTINAAYAINRGDQLGSLEPGKQADILILNLADYREIPRRLGVNHVAMAFRNGLPVINLTGLKVGAA